LLAGARKLVSGSGGGLEVVFCSFVDGSRNFGISRHDCASNEVTVEDVNGSLWRWFDPAGETDFVPGEL
jgi:hypothetical protein